MNLTGTIVTIDSNEVAHHAEYKNFAFDGCLVCFASLPAGDFRIDRNDGDIILIERKAPPDLLASIKNDDGRLVNQVVEMLAITKWVYVLVAGDLLQSPNGKAMYYGGGKWNETEWNWHAIQGQLLSLQELGAAVMFGGDIQGAIKMIMNRAHGTIKVTPRRQPYIFSEQENILMAIPSIGSETAAKLLAEFHTPAAALIWLTSNDPTPVKGVHAHMRENARRYLGSAI